MSLFKNLTETKNLDEQAQDRLGGYQPLESGIYRGEIKEFYGSVAKSGAMAVNLAIEIDGHGEYRETVYVTTREGNNFFMTGANKDKKAPLAGFTVANDICLFTTGQNLYELDTEEKVVDIYDFDARQRVPTKVPMVVDVLGEEIAIGVIKVLENKREKVGTDYVDTADSRFRNEIDKVFHPELQVTVAEARRAEAEDEEPVASFWDKWRARNEGQTRDKRTIKDGASAPAKPATPPKAGDAKAPVKKTNSLFNKK